MDTGGRKGGRHAPLLSTSRANPVQLRTLQIWLISAAGFPQIYIIETNWGGYNNTLGIFYAWKGCPVIPVALLSSAPGYLVTHPIPSRTGPDRTVGTNHFFLSDRCRTAVCPIGPDETATVRWPCFAPFARTPAGLPQHAALAAAQQSGRVAPSRRAGPLRVGCACCRGANAG